MYTLYVEADRFARQGYHLFIKAYDGLCNCVDEIGVNVVKVIYDFRSRGSTKPNDKKLERYSENI